MNLLNKTAYTTGRQKIQPGLSADCSKDEGQHSTHHPTPLAEKNCCFKAMQRNEKRNYERQGERGRNEERGKMSKWGGMELERQRQQRKERGRVGYKKATGKWPTKMRVKWLSRFSDFTLTLVAKIRNNIEEIEETNMDKSWNEIMEMAYRIFERKNRFVSWTGLVLKLPLNSSWKIGSTADENKLTDTQLVVAAAVAVVKARIRLPDSRFPKLLHVQRTAIFNFLHFVVSDNPHIHGCTYGGG
jgi:hypothetical protein